MLEDVEEPMPARPVTLRDPGTPDQIVMEQHSLTLSQSTLVQDVCRIPRTRFTTSRTVENLSSCTSTSA